MIDPTLAGIRGTMAFRQWAELANLYPPALAALTSARDDRMRALQLGSRDVQLFSDVEAINRELSQTSLTVRLFAEIAETDATFAQWISSIARPALIAHDEFALARRLMDSPQRILERSRLWLDDSLEGISRLDPDERAIAREAYIGAFAEGLFQILTILTGDGQRDEATRVWRDFLASDIPADLRPEILSELQGFARGTNVENLLAP